MYKILEICCYSVESAIEAQNKGANRIELCDNYSEGGTTPSYGSIQLAVNKLNIPINVIIRPRGGDFLYSDVEYEIIKLDIAILKKMKINGIVIGFIKSNGDIDTERTREIVELAKPLEVTFHRAFDMCRNHFFALEQLTEIGVKRILTSGAKDRAIDGVDLITKLIKKADNKIIIMPGSGINANNLMEIMDKTKANEFHSSAKTFEESKMKFFNNNNISMGGVKSIDEFKKVKVDPLSIEQMIRILQTY